MLPQLVGQHQYAFLSGKRTVDNAMLLQMAIDRLKHTNRKGLAVFLDMAKAYDRVHHDYLRRVMVHCGFDHKFISWVEALYNGATSQVMVNGHLSPGFSIRRGVPQGDALSCGLFLLAAAPLAARISACDTLTGVDC